MSEVAKVSGHLYGPIHGASHNGLCANGVTHLETILA
jgi:hypothetical protein